MFKIYVLLLTTALFFVNTLYLPKGKDLEKVEEIQNAICSIATKEFEATANATVTRQLKGVCTSNELHLRIDQLQTKILQEIEGIRYILETNGFKVPDVPIHPDYPTSDIVFPNSNSTYVNDTVVKTPVSIIEESVTNNLSSRMEEISLYNDTVIDSTDGNKYFYYWKIQNIHNLLAKKDLYKSSPDFSVLGHTLHLQFYPNYLDSSHFAVLLKPDSNGFVKKHRLTILNQLESGLDLASGILYGMRNEERMLRVSEKNLDVGGFIVDDVLVVKLEILLNS